MAESFCCRVSSFWGAHAATLWLAAAWRERDRKSSSSNSRAIEYRLENLFGLENFMGDSSSRARMFCIIKVDHFYGLNNLA
jgi:hypothetical protein